MLEFDINQSVKVSKSGRLQLNGVWMQIDDQEIIKLARGRSRILLSEVLSHISERKILDAIQNKYEGYQGVSERYKKQISNAGGKTRAAFASGEYDDDEGDEIARDYIEDVIISHAAASLDRAYAALMNEIFDCACEDVERDGKLIGSLKRSMPFNPNKKLVLDDEDYLKYASYRDFKIYADVFIDFEMQGHKRHFYIKQNYRNSEYYCFGGADRNIPLQYNLDDERQGNFWRRSLYLTDKDGEWIGDTGDGIYNIMALLNNGYHAKDYAYGIWQSHSDQGAKPKVIRSRKDFEGYHFVERGLNQFNANNWEYDGILAYLNFDSDYYSTSAIEHIDWF